jgi:hypothetical protein
MARSPQVVVPGRLHQTVGRVGCGAGRDLLAARERQELVARRAHEVQELRARAPLARQGQDGAVLLVEVPVVVRDLDEWDALAEKAEANA